MNRKDLLHAKVKPKKKVYPFVTEFNPRAPNISQIISKHKHLISTSEWKEIFPDKSIITAYRRPKNLKGIWQYIFLLFHCKELLKLYVNLLYRFCVTILFLEIF